MKEPGDKLKLLNEITNTPRAKKVAIAEPEKAVIVEDDEILELNLFENTIFSREFSDEESEELFKDLKLSIKDIVQKSKSKI